VEGDLQANDFPKQAGRAMLISDKVHLILKLVIRDKECHFILIRGAIHQEEITIVNLNVPTVSAPNCLKHTLLDLKTKIEPKAVLVLGFNTPLSPTNRSLKQKIYKETLELNDIRHEIDLADVYREFHPATTQCTFFSAAHGTFSKIDHILVTKQV
jgi:hypothetical protein